MPLKVVGAGLGRTGTASLKVALEMLGLGRCYHMSEVIQSPDAFAWWVDAADGRPDWESIFAGYGATVDYPACSSWRALAAYYPSAKVVLSVRDPEKWFESTQSTIFSPQMNAHIRTTPVKEFFEKCVWKEFGPRIDERDFMIAAFNRHTQEVKRAIPASRLLVYDVAQGWAPLCEFLNIPAPGEPFPHANTREDFQAILEALKHTSFDQLAKAQAIQDIHKDSR